MNSDTDVLIEEILIESAAVEKCPICCDFLVKVGDSDAEKMAYARATNNWKSGVRGFRDMEREEVVAMIERALASAPRRCPRCD